MSFKIFIGIDQTGATKINGEPKPLNICLIDARDENIKIKSRIKIKKLSFSEINHTIKIHVPNYKNENCLICIDTVFGLPSELGIPIDQIFSDSQKYIYKNKPYGAITAHRFFNQYLKNKIHIPQRCVEKMTGANSVFKLTPYQKNIGCGSYRIIKELSQEKKWYSLWPFENSVKKFVIAEGYPSYFWKHEMNLKNRNLQKLKELFPELHFKTLDEADSFILAYGAYKNSTKMNTLKMNKKYKSEGWILGVQNES